MKNLLLIFTSLLMLTATSAAQTTPRIQKLEQKRSLIHKHISESETLLGKTGRDAKSQLTKLEVLTEQIKKRIKYIQVIRHDLKVMDDETRILNKQLLKLEKQLKEKRSRYAASLRKMRQNRGVGDKLIFILSADDLNQMFRRTRYMREYAKYQEAKGREILAKHKETTAKREQVKATAKIKKDLLRRQEKEQERLTEQEKEKKELIKTLQKKQRDIKKEIQKKKIEAAKLNKEIDKLIEIEIEKERKRAEARRRAAEKRKKEALKKSANKKTEKKASSKIPSRTAKTSDMKLSSNFEHNRGRLPRPITGPNAITSHYGRYNVAGMRSVKLDNKGIDIKGKRGAMAKAIFDGEVSAIFRHAGLDNILIRHGRYISVYCNLKSVRVRQGEKVTTGQLLGTVADDNQGGATLHFQLRRETTKLNPEHWIKN